MKMNQNPPAAGCIHLVAEMDIAPRLFGALQRVLPLNITALSADAERSMPAKAALLQSSQGGSFEALSDLERLVLPSMASEAILRGTVQVKFSDVLQVPWPFRGRTLESEVSAAPCRLEPDVDEIVLAACDGQPVWTMAVRQGHAVFRSAFPLLEMAEDGSFALTFSDQAFIQNLPLLHLLRHVGSDVMGEVPPLRAAFMFDDPNLHWPTYGCIDYREVVERARKHRYHVSFATIPLDTWFTHRSTADIFRRHPDAISLLVHGNNHSKNELARQRLASDREALVSQALERIVGLEHGTGLKVCRVMVPPHGGCSADMLVALAGAGFEGACISAGSLMAHNPGAGWIPTLGFHPAEIIQGCPVLPRAAFTGRARNAALICAYLGRPIVLRGHQDDLKHGIELLDELAGFVNGLGEVTWTNMSSLMRLSYRYRVEAGTCYLTPLAPQVDFEIPASAQRLVVARAPGQQEGGSILISSTAGTVRVCAGESWLLEGSGRQYIRLVRDMQPRLIDPPRAPRTPASLILRRLLTEGRDRFLTA